jgi:hypothetical protein
MCKGEIIMKVCDLISKMPDNYVDIAINEYKGLKHTGRRYIIEKHSNDCTHIPEEIWNAEVNMIVPYYDRISIEIEAKE